MNEKFLFIVAEDVKEFVTNGLSLLPSIDK